MSTPVSSTFCGDPSQGRPSNLIGFMMDDILPSIKQLVSQLHAGHAATSSKILNNIGALWQAIMDIEQAIAGDCSWTSTSISPLTLTDIIILPNFLIVL